MALSVTVFLLIVILNFWSDNLVQYSINEVRANLLSETHIALDTINEDIRLSATADQNNRWQDQHAPGAPTNLLSWQSTSSTLVLATAAQDHDGNILFADASKYISHKNNDIYFVNGGNLYRRILAAPVANNKAVTSCPKSASSSACPADKVLVKNVTSFDIKYLNGENQEVQPTQARAVELTLKLATSKFNKDITAEYTTRMVFRNE